MEHPPDIMRSELKKHRSLIISIILTALTAAVIGYIFYHSSLDAVESTVQSDSVMDGLGGFLRIFGIDAELSEHVIRKLAHFTEYFALGALLCLTAYSYVRRRGRMLLIALPSGLAVAVCDELIQLGSEGRSCEVRDMLLDYCAVLTAALTVTLILYLVSRRKEKKMKLKEVSNDE